MKSEGLAYWTGVVQSDGCLKTYFDKKKNNLKYLISFNVAKKSLPMLEKFRDLSTAILNRNANIFKMNYCEIWSFHISVKKLLENFKNLDISFGDPPKPPNWSLFNNDYFGAYLAGLIDGDGDIRIKRKKYPQCVVRITNGHEQNELKKSIERLMNCSVIISRRERESEINGRKIHGVSYELEFYVSSKNFKFINEFIIPCITINHKKEKLQSYIKSRWPE
jgi:hypothetical protein